MNLKTASPWPVVSIAFLLAAAVQSLTIGIHEAIHALTCVAVGHEVVVLSALHVDCTPSDPTSFASKLVAGSAPLFNLALALVPALILRRPSPAKSGNLRWFLWLLMFSNFSAGFGYLLFSGVSGAGDLAVVVFGWEPAEFWRIGMLVLGGGLWFGSVWFSLWVLAGIFGGHDPVEQRRRFLMMSVPSYLGAVTAIVLAAAQNPEGMTALPALAGIFAAVGTLSPLLWTPFWFASSSFKRAAIAPTQLRLVPGAAIVGVVIPLAYVLLMGPGIRF